jgi:hypothetical protein
MFAIGLHPFLMFRVPAFLPLEFAVSEKRQTSFPRQPVAGADAYPAATARRRRSAFCGSTSNRAPSEARRNINVVN